MQISDWNKRWQQNLIGFHEPEPNQYLTQFISTFKLKAGATIFVPLCGKSHDLKWLAEQGFQVIGIECSSVAVEDFFNQHGLNALTRKIDQFTVYRCDNITIYQGDFFSFNQSHLAQCDLIYDRASMIALSEEKRPQYTDHLKSWLSSNTHMLLITLSYDQNIMNGPPFSVSYAEVENAYNPKHIKILTQNDVIDEGPRWRKVGLKSLIETAFSIS